MPPTNPDQPAEHPIAQADIAATPKVDDAYDREEEKFETGLPAPTAEEEAALRTALAAAADTIPAPKDRLDELVAAPAPEPEVNDHPDTGGLILPVVNPKAQDALPTQTDGAKEDNKISRFAAPAKLDDETAGLRQPEV